MQRGKAPVGVEEIILRQAPQENPDETLDRFSRFLANFPDAHVRRRPDEIIRDVIGPGTLFFCENSAGEIVATTGFYLYGERKAAWGEIGSSLVHPSYRGARLQGTMYSHILPLMYFSDWPERGVLAVTDVDALASIISMGRVGFEEIRSIPQDIASLATARGWSKILSGEKRLFVLPKAAIVGSLRFVLNNGKYHPVMNKHGETRYYVRVDFRYLDQSGLREALREEIDRLESTQ